MSPLEALAIEAWTEIGEPLACLLHDPDRLATCCLIVAKLLADNDPTDVVSESTPDVDRHKIYAVSRWLGENYTPTPMRRFP